MFQPSEGLRVKLTKDVKTLFQLQAERVGPLRNILFPPVRVPFRSGSGEGCHDWLNVIPAGAVGTLYEFRIRRGAPTRGFPHPRMWGVRWDSYPPGLSGHGGITDTSNLEQLNEPQAQHLAALRAKWQEAEYVAEAYEKELSKLFAALPDGVYTNTVHTQLSLEYTPRRQKADRLRKEYDDALYIVREY